MFSFLVSLEDGNHGTLLCGRLARFDAHTNGYLGGRTMGRAQGVQSVRLPFGRVALLPASCAVCAWLEGQLCPCCQLCLCSRAMDGWKHNCPSVSLMDGLSLDVGWRLFSIHFFGFFSLACRVRLLKLLFSLLSPGIFLGSSPAIEYSVLSYYPPSLTYLRLTPVVVSCSALAEL